MRGLSDETAGIYARRIECDLKRGRYDAAFHAIREAEQRETTFRRGDFLDLDIVEAGVSHNDAARLNSAGIFLVKELEQETVKSLQEIAWVSEEFAKRVFGAVAKHRAMFRLGVARI